MAKKSYFKKKIDLLVKKMFLFSKLDQIVGVQGT